MQPYFKALMAFLLLTALLSGGYAVFQREFLENMKQRAVQELGDGNYLASILQLNELKEISEDESVIESAELDIQKAQDLLVAEKNFEKAKTAAEEGDWLVTKTILEGDAAVINTSFKYYQEAIDLFLEASEKIKYLEEKIDTEIRKLKDEAVEEKKLRETAEAQAAETQEQLETTIEERAIAETVLKRQIRENESKVELAKGEIATERLEKFKNELDVYREMLVTGIGHLDNALGEVENNNNTNAFALISVVSQGKTLFDEVEVLGQELLEQRTPKEHKIYTNKLMQAAALLIEASQRTVSLVFSDMGGTESEFETLLNEIKQRKNTALQLIQEIQNFISS
ncbi:hypothetical protein CL630_01770 [bacterium]|nr:hypothetical protein [bacterium]|tara:strand:+ start:14914 stop:15939 length:1026 start_codon:yes stop_codon:yes gene_type:complete